MHAHAGALAPRQQRLAPRLEARGPGGHLSSRQALADWQRRRCLGLLCRQRRLGLGPRLCLADAGGGQGRLQLGRSTLRLLALCSCAAAQLLRHAGGRARHRARGGRRAGAHRGHRRKQALQPALCAAGGLALRCPLLGRRLCLRSSSNGGLAQGLQGMNASGSDWG